MFLPYLNHSSYSPEVIAEMEAAIFEQLSLASAWWSAWLLRDETAKYTAKSQLHILVHANLGPNFLFIFPRNRSWCIPGKQPCFC